MTYVPLWCKTNYSFLEGAVHPDHLVERAAALGLPAVAVTDRDGLYGIARAHVEAKRLGVRLIVGAEITLGEPHSACTLVVLVRNHAGYRALCRLITQGRTRYPKGQCAVSVAECAHHAQTAQGGWFVLVPPVAVQRIGDGDWNELFGSVDRTRVYALVSRAQRAADFAAELRARRWATHHQCRLIGAIDVLYAVPEERPLQDVLTCIRHGTTIFDAGTVLCANDEQFVYPVERMYERYADAADLVTETLVVAENCEFSLDEIRYRYPEEHVPTGRTTAQWLAELTYAGARRRYGNHLPPVVGRQLVRELDIIDELEYCGYFLTMWEIVQYCLEHAILCQGRGSAANSVVCYSLGITAVDPIQLELLFERFISRERAEPPDIDLDIEHHRREEVIQFVYRRYGRDRAAMVANVVRYRRRSSIREVGKVLGLSAVVLDQIAKRVGHHDRDLRSVLTESGLVANHVVVERLVELSERLYGFPRHLSIHPGGFLLGNTPVNELVPIEQATMVDRTVIQWDKYDVEELGLFKVDLLALGALTHLQYTFALIRRYYQVTLSMADIPKQDSRTFSMLRRAQTVGVFQVESRAQMAMLPRLKPRELYDLVIEISIVRPGPIAGGMVHPFLRRRNGQEKVVYPHPELEQVLKKTLGVPLFQEQVMRLAMVAADYTPGEADQLRRDMAAWRRSGRLEMHHARLVDRMVAKGIGADFAEQVYEQIKGFGEYGFPESHAASFALIAYCTAWVRCHYFAAFVAGLLNAWPMGFYSPAAIVADARRCGLVVRPVDVQHSGWLCDLEPLDTNGAFALRIGLRYIRGLNTDAADRLIAQRPAGGFADSEEFFRLVALDSDVFIHLCEAGALRSLGIERRDAVWRVLARRNSPSTRSSGGQRADTNRSQTSQSSPAQRQPIATPLQTQPLPTFDQYLAESWPAFANLSRYEQIAWDYQSVGHSTDGHPLEPFRAELHDQGIPDAARLRLFPNHAAVRYIGMVICRQRPDTAGGVVFVTLEDESGFVNLIVWERVFERYRSELLTAVVLGVAGTLQIEEQVRHVVVEHCWLPTLSNRPTAVESRDFPLTPTAARSHCSTDYGRSAWSTVGARPHSSLVRCVVPTQLILE